jgi:hypothetical protein
VVGQATVQLVILELDDAFDTTFGVITVGLEHWSLLEQSGSSLGDHHDGKEDGSREDEVVGVHGSSLHVGDLDGLGHDPAVASAYLALIQLGTESLEQVESLIRKLTEVLVLGANQLLVQDHVGFAGEGDGVLEFDEGAGSGRSHRVVPFHQLCSHTTVDLNLNQALFDEVDETTVDHTLGHRQVRNSLVLEAHAEQTFGSLDVVAVTGEVGGGLGTDGVKSEREVHQCFLHQL